MPLQMAYFKSRKMHRMLRKVINNHSIDIVHTQHLRMSQYTAKLDMPKVLDLPDAFSLYWKRRRDTDRKWYFKIIDKLEISRLVKAEKIINHYNLCLVCSEEDKRYLEKVHKSDDIDLLLNGVDLSTFDVGEGHDYTIDDSILFTGNMDYAPNVDAVVYFSKNILPILLEQRPSLQFVIAGQRPVNAVQQLASENIKITGFIPQLQDIYKESAVLVAPLRFGAGTQNKVLEAMAMGLPVVCTNIGFEGLQIESGEGALLAKNDKQFVQHVLNLLESKDLRERVGLKGVQIAENKFSWDVVSKNLETHFQSVLNK